MKLSETQEGQSFDLGVLVIALLVGALGDLRDRLWADGFRSSADVVADLVIRCDRYLEDCQ